MEKFTLTFLIVLIICMSIVLFSDKFNREEYTYWLITVQKPSNTGNTIMVTSSLKTKNKFITSKIINAYYNELYSETGKWNILFYSKLTKEEFNLYNSNDNQNE